MNMLTCFSFPQCLRTAAVGLADQSPVQIFVGFSQQVHSTPFVLIDSTWRELFHLPGVGNPYHISIIDYLNEFQLVLKMWSKNVHQIFSCVSSWFQFGCAKLTRTQKNKVVMDAPGHEKLYASFQLLKSMTLSLLASVLLMAFETRTWGIKCLYKRRPS